MPYIIRWPHKRVVALVASCAALLVTAAPAAADTTPCSVPASSPVFSVLGDQSNYSLLAGGSFQDGAQGWTLNNASVVSGGEPLNVSGVSTPQSLEIQPGGSATSPAMCLSNAFPTWRFFARSASAAFGSSLQVWVQWSDSQGHSGYVPAATLFGGQYSSWQATPALPLGSVLPNGTTVTIRFVFRAAPTGGAWNVDDIYVDPYAI